MKELHKIGHYAAHAFLILIVCGSPMNPLEKFVVSVYLLKAAFHDFL